MKKKIKNMTIGEMLRNMGLDQDERNKVLKGVDETKTLAQLAYKQGARDMIGFAIIRTMSPAKTPHKITELNDYLEIIRDEFIDSLEKGENNE